MNLRDFRDCEISGATPAALEAFERALAAYQSWRSGAEQALAPALQEAPSFVMAHAMQAYLRLSSRDPAQVRSAAPLLERAARLPANPREQLHLGAIRAVLADDYDRAKDILGNVLRAEPRDLLALQVGHALDYVTGDVDRMGGRVRDVLPAWSRDLPGYHAVLAMHAFALQEGGRYERAEDIARRAIAMEPFDARAHHVLAHVFEMSERADAGIDWMYRHVKYWAEGTVVATHCWWHLALFHLARDEVVRALSIYDRRVRAGQSRELADLIDAAALLWRIELQGGNAGSRWIELSSAWAPHVGDAFCTFNDIHAMLAFVGAGDWNRARRLERELAHRQLEHTRFGEMTRSVGLPACRGLIAFGQGDYGRAIGQLGNLPAFAHRIGGSQLQRDVIDLTLLQAVERAGRPGLRTAA